MRACSVLLDRFECDVEGETLDLEVELEAGDAVLGAGDLEVHIAEVVFRTEDVGEDDVLADLAVGIALGDETGGDTGARCGDRHTGIHEGEAAAADGRHGSGAVGAHDFGDDADGVWELVFWRKDRKQGALCECTVSDFAATGESETTCFTGGERREVVVKDEGLAGRATGQAVDVLHVAAGAEGGDDEGLCFTAVEDGGAVNAWKHAGVAGDGAQVRSATAVDAAAGLEDVLAVELFLDLVEGASDVVAVYVFGTELLFESSGGLLGDGFDGELALGVAVVAEGCLDLFCSVLFAESVTSTGVMTSRSPSWPCRRLRRVPSVP